MSTVEQRQRSSRIEAAKDVLRKEGYIMVIWHDEDIAQECPHLTPEQRVEVAQTIERIHDCNVGINWEVISMVADMLFGKKDKV